MASVPSVQKKSDLNNDMNKSERHILLELTSNLKAMLFHLSHLKNDPYNEEQINAHFTDLVERFNDSANLSNLLVEMNLKKVNEDLKHFKINKKH